MRNRVRPLRRANAQAKRGAVVVLVMVIAVVTGAGAASAETLAQGEPGAFTFGILGPVGLVAVGIGVLGMAAGVIRQRKKAAAKAAEALEPVAEEEQAAEPALREVRTKTCIAGDLRADLPADFRVEDDSTRPVLSPVARRRVRSAVYSRSGE
ncbi:hypothetical protein [Amycolatopsis sp. CA-230715]|uniref:hypothetical protein n=1 Tax=Amycolatopsis sp. CA-230715 TaxID=2745196 RepID=UPI001C02456B|nr:hypothetical protein [Amycolatopsis sp. CA-230715]QWF79461.1 hypothetical protein HUW46_02869 [Amycolatopsis sp. CA-230715]